MYAVHLIKLSPVALRTFNESKSDFLKREGRVCSIFVKDAYQAVNLLANIGLPTACIKSFFRCQYLFVLS